MNKLNKFSNTKFTNIILSLAGLELSTQERSLFAAIKPVGIILFGRNVGDANQLRCLCDEIKSIIAEDVLILIDQEGGRVMRVKFGLNRMMKSPEELLKIAANKPDIDAATLIRAQYLLSALELRDLGINVNCAPVADLHYSFADKIIGDRSFGKNPSDVAKMCEMVDSALAYSSVQGVIKHIPGHGRALVDSHKKLPVIDASIADLEATDFAVFKKLSKMKMAMTAHVIYNALDPNLPFTHSAKGIEYVRDKLQFNGILLTDDLCMKALSSDIDKNFKEAIKAGCDIGLYCPGKIDEMRSISNHATELSPDLLEKFHKLNCFNPINPKINEYKQKMAVLFQQMVA